MKPSRWLLALAAIPIASSAGSLGHIAEFTQLMDTPNILEFSPLQCELSRDVGVELLAEAPMLDPEGETIEPGYYKRVRVLDGRCAGRVGWITQDRFAESPEPKPASVRR